MTRVVVTPQAQKDFAKIPERDQRKIKKRLKYLETEIYAGKRLSGGLKEIYSLRAWPYRIFYLLKDGKAWITHIEHRQNAYKKRR